MAAALSGAVNRMRPLRILQIASASGNIGDNANHAGTFSRLEAALGVPLEPELLEIRTFYWRERAFDDSFVALCRGYDLVMFGGGNYFELWVEHSRTGCSIDLLPTQIEAIDRPVLFYALGCDRHQGVPPICQQRFSAFLDFLLQTPSCFVSVRNDGSRQALREHFGADRADAVTIIPDGGFFYDPPSCEQVELAGADRSLVINLAGDMLEKRFPGGVAHDPAGFLAEMAATLVALCQQDPGLRVVLVPHIPSDLTPLSHLLALLPARLQRTRLRVAPYLVGAPGAAKIFDLYRRASLVWGMRFHANVCPLGRGRPTLGLGCYGQVRDLYDELAMQDCLVEVTKAGFGQTLLAKSQQMLTEPAKVEAMLADVRQRLDVQAGLGQKKIAAWLERALR